MERTLAIIKPDAVSRQLIGEIIKRYEHQGFKIVAMKKTRITKSQAEGFYHVHRQRPFFESLASFMAGGPMVVLVLEGEDVIKRHRDLMGATNPKEAAQGTIRRDFGADIEHNAVHGSDSRESAQFEIGYFFSGLELQS
ncbi:MAG TPA: nucleoside-diphosphate kinase [Nitrospiria bacterium]|nr:nucleoside-diphosphate kinase [Nitrospiria bacterium]